MQSKKTATADKPAQHVIKKYPNRRLYDTASSSYVTLAKIKQLVMDNVSFVVRDAKTDEDLTRSILLQIILEEEAGGTPIFSEAALANLIRFYGHAAQGFMGAYLEKNVQAFSDFQNRLAEQAKSLSPDMWTQFMSMQNPLMHGLMSNYAEQSKNLFDQMQEQVAKQTEQMLSAFGIKR